MQRRDPGQGPHSQVRGCYKVEIQEGTPPATLQTQDGLAVNPARLSPHPTLYTAKMCRGMLPLGAMWTRFLNREYL